MKFVSAAILTILALGVLTLLFLTPMDVAVNPIPTANAPGTTASAGGSSSTLPTLPEAPPPMPPPHAVLPQNGSNDLPNQPQLSDPPAIVKGIYLTGWSAGSPSKVQSVVDLAKKTELNAVVVDIKDYSGYVSYAMDIPEVRAVGAEREIRIARPNAMIKRFHDASIYVIGRITVFQDPILAKVHPEWALADKTTGEIWKDNKGLSWMDPAAKPVWDYLASITRDAFARGFDEIQFDYIRFASDGSLGNISYPYWDEKTSMASVIASYFKFLREQFPNQKISADLFGLATVNNDDLGIGQVIQSAYQYFDYVSPMVYPSHYATGFLGYTNPAKYPYEVISYSMEHALGKLLTMGNTNSTVSTASSSLASSSSPTSSSTATTTATTTTPRPYSPFNLGYVPPTKLRPWLQDFTIYGVPYTADMVRKEKQAIYDTLNTTSSNQYYAGWLLWNASNIYTAGALDPPQ